MGTLDRGTLSGGNITSKTFDQTGNWANFKQDDNGDGTWDLNQNRTHNLANEIATIQVWGAVVHDALGNMTRIPKPSSPANRYACIWDAWNRLVEVKETDGSGNPTTTVAAYAYDGFYRRTKKVIGASTRDYYYSLGWQVLEERVGGTLDRQFVWGIRHIDDLVLRDRGAERLYAVHDAMHVTAVTNASGAVQERYGYDAFGKPRFMDASFGARSASSFDWEILFDSYRFDTETGLYQVRFRYLHPGLGRWLSRDPIGELSGCNAYLALANRATSKHDPRGLWIEDEDGFPLLPTGTVLDAYFYDPQTRAEHDRIMSEGLESLLGFGQEVCEQAALSCVPFGIGKLCRPFGKWFLGELLGKQLLPKAIYEGLKHLPKDDLFKELWRRYKGLSLVPFGIFLRYGGTRRDLWDALTKHGFRLTPSATAGLIAYLMWKYWQLLSAGRQDDPK